MCPVLCGPIRGSHRCCEIMIALAPCKNVFGRAMRVEGLYLGWGRGASVYMQRPEKDVKCPVTSLHCISLRQNL